MNLASTPAPSQLTLDAALNRAHAHWDAGQAREAETLCQNILAVFPTQSHALHLLGIMAHAYGKRDLSISLLAQACAAPDATAVHHTNRAEICRQAGLLQDAEVAGRRAVALDPSLTDAWNNLGIVLQESGQLADSLACLQRVASLQPDSAQALNNLGNTLMRLGDNGAAETHYRRALTLQPDFADVHSNLALLLQQRGNLAEAETHARRAIELAPSAPAAYRNLAEIQLAQQAPGAARQTLEVLRSFAPDADPLKAQRTPAPDTAPQDPQLVELQAIERDARVLLSQGRYAEAEARIAPALASGSGPITLWRLQAAAIRFQGRPEEARAIQQMVVDTVPGQLSARFDLAEILLLLGDFDRGWREYRYRYSLAHTTDAERKIQQPRWDGEPIPGKTLLIHDEQGFGDTFQFLRMVAWARERSGARVILQAMPEVLPLAERAGGFDAIVPRGVLPPAFDLHCELMSLPMAMGLQLDQLPGQVPYLRADEARLARWRARLADIPRPWVALVWAGRPTHHNDAHRSLSLSTFAPLARSGASFLAIQKGDPAAQAATPPEGMHVHALGDEIVDFDDTAAILELADLLISVDSSPVHLAGALGRPVWTLLPFVPDWRWLMEREDTPWYPSMQLFRQHAIGAWDDVIERVAAALTDWAAGANRTHR